MLPCSSTDGDCVLCFYPNKSVFVSVEIWVLQKLLVLYKSEGGNFDKCE